MAALPELDGASWRELVEAPVAVLVLGKTDCNACAEWTGALEEFLGRDEEFSGRVRFGKIYLDKRGLADFKRENAWVAEVDALPFNQIYRNGERVRSFAGGGTDRLVNRLRNVLAGS